MKQILIEVKQNYGTQAIYPACEQAKLFAAIAGTKTLTEHTLRLIKNLGYEVQVKAQEYQIAA